MDFKSFCIQKMWNEVSVIVTALLNKVTDHGIQKNNIPLRFKFASYPFLNVIGICAHP